MSLWRRLRSPSDWDVVTVANDGVFDWAVALLASLARHAPGRDVLVIPYDDRVERLAPAIAELGNAKLWAPPELRGWDELGAEIYPGDSSAARGFRKLAAFHVPAARFLYVDADALALAPLEELLVAVERSGADLVHFDTDVDQVYRPGAWRDSLRDRGRGVGFNGGLFAGRARVVDPDRVRGALAALPGDWGDYLVPLAEQAFLNLTVDHLELSVRGASELLADVCSTCWPAVGRLVEEDGAFRLRDSGRWDEGWRFLFAHWAGYQLSESMPNHAVWAAFRALAPR